MPKQKFCIYKLWQNPSSSNGSSDVQTERSVQVRIKKITFEE